MDKNPHIEREGMNAEEFTLTPESEEAKRLRRGPEDHGSTGRSLIFGAVGIIILIAVFIFSLRAHERSLTGDLNALRGGIDRLGAKMNQLEGQVGGLQQYMTKLYESDQSLTQQLYELSDKLEAPRREASAPARMTEARREVVEKPTTQPKPRYHEVSRGDTLYRIARKYGISVAELCSLNNINPGQAIHPGQKLLVPSGSEE